MERYSPTIIIGAGQCGLAISAELTRHGMEHIILERGQVANSWRTERWDSLRLLTPNWMNGLLNQDYEGNDATGFMTVGELVERFERCVQVNTPPVSAETTVLSVDADSTGYRVQTDQGLICCNNLVMANGACGMPKIPAFADKLSPHVMQTTPAHYKRPADLPPGKVLVVGASASGLQLAKEIQLSGHDVILAVGNHTRLPRRYQGIDICVWMDLMGTTSIPYDQVEDIQRLRRTPSLSLVAEQTLDLNLLQNLGVEVTGRLVGIHDGSALFAGSLANLCVAADLKMKRLLASINQWQTTRGIAGKLDADDAFNPTAVPDLPRLKIDLRRENIASVVWATGYTPDFRWLNLPVFDAKNTLAHDGGFVRNGLYVTGLPYLRQRRSTFLQGAGQDARDIVNHMRLVRHRMPQTQSMQAA